MKYNDKKAEGYFVEANKRGTKYFVQSNKREADHNAANAKHELTSKNSRIGALTKEIRDLQSGEQSKLNAFGPHMSKLGT